jgi:2-oxoglutarate dehydrogenase E2 component (dihydrolipoamide succinyltransferase)
MIEEVKIPQMGESVTEATIGNILKSDGTNVSEGEELIELETEKVNQVLYAPIAGVISWKIKGGEKVEIGQVIGSIDSDQVAKQEVKEKKPKEEAKKQEEMKKPSPPTGGGQRVMMEEFVRDLKEPKPMPPPSAPSRKAPQAGEKRRKMSTIRQTIGKRLVDSLHTAAMLTTFNEVDMSAIMALRGKYQEKFVEKHGVKLGLMSFFVKAVVEGLKAFPDFNSYIDQGEIVTYEAYNIAIAVGTEKGLVVPVIRNCEKKSFAEIEKEIADYAQKAKSGKLSISDLEGGGFTISNGGIYGSMLSTPILNPPQTGILGMHKIMKRPVVEGDAVVIRPMMYLALSYDHRLVDGREAVTFLVRIKEILEDPTRLIFSDEI